MGRIVVAMAVAIVGASGTAMAETTHYYVYCASDKIEVDSRSPEQMKIARGSGVCQFARFNYLSDAQSFAKKNFGGPGNKCACK